MTNTRNTPVEALEHVYPFRVEAYRVRRGSGGEGRHRGGDGVVRRYRFEEPAEVTLLTERRRHAPWGVAGGGAGAKGENLLIGGDGGARLLPGKTTFRVERGEAVEVRTPGGGGWSGL